MKKLFILDIQKFISLQNENLMVLSHPSLAVLCSDMRKEDRLVRVDLVNPQRGQPPTKRIKQIYVQLQKRLRRLCQDNEAGIRDMEGH